MPFEKRRSTFTCSALYQLSPLLSSRLLMRPYCGNGLSDCATEPPKPGKTAFGLEGKVTPRLAAYCRSAGVTSASGLLSSGKPSLNASNGTAFNRAKFDFRRSPLL